MGAPPVWQENTAVFPSVTVWSNGGKVNLGATPAMQKEDERKGGGNSLVIDCMSRCRYLINFPEFIGPTEQDSGSDSQCGLVLEGYAAVLKDATKPEFNLCN